MHNTDWAAHGLPTPEAVTLDTDELTSAGHDPADCFAVRWPAIQGRCWVYLIKTGKVYTVEASVGALALDRQKSKTMSKLFPFILEYGVTNA